MKGTKIMAVEAVNNSMYVSHPGKEGAIVVNYDDPKIKDEECTYTFNKDGSASCVSNAWGTKTELPKGTLKKDASTASPEEMVNLFKSYQKDKKLDVQA